MTQFKSIVREGITYSTLQGQAQTDALEWIGKHQLDWAMQAVGDTYYFHQGVWLVFNAKYHELECLDAALQLVADAMETDKEAVSALTYKADALEKRLKGLQVELDHKNKQLQNYHDKYLQGEIIFVKPAAKEAAVKPVTIIEEQPRRKMQSFEQQMEAKEVISPVMREYKIQNEQVVAFHLMAPMPINLFFYILQLDIKRMTGFKFDIHRALKALYTDGLNIYTAYDKETHLYKELRLDFASAKWAGHIAVKPNLCWKGDSVYFCTTQGIEMALEVISRDAGVQLKWTAPKLPAAVRLSPPTSYCPLSGLIARLETITKIPSNTIQACIRMWGNGLGYRIESPQERGWKDLSWDTTNMIFIPEGKTIDYLAVPHIEAANAFLPILNACGIFVNFIENPITALNQSI